MGAAAAAAGTGATLLGNATVHGAEEEVHDAIVIGAGFAGVTAAKELRAKGKKKVLILEARDRIGGRTWTSTFAGEKVEMGGTWVHQKQAHIWGEIDRLGIPLITDEGPTKAIFPTEGGGYAEVDMVEGFTRQTKLLEKVLEGSRDYFPEPYDPFKRQDLLADLDGLSLRDRFDQLRFSPIEEAYLHSTTGAYGGGLARGALTQLAHWWALSDWNMDTFQAINTIRPTIGLPGVLQKLLDESGARVALNAPVSSVTDDGTVVRVTAGGRTYRGATAVVAVPTNLWNSIDFKPGLPAEYRRMATQTVGVPTTKKVWLHVAGDIGRPLANTAAGELIDGLIPMMKTSSGLIMLAFSVSPDLDVRNKTQIQSAVRKLIPAAEVLEVKGKDWGADPYAKGGWTFKRPGQLLGSLRAVRQRQGRIAFATSDISTGWNGYVDGAVESGLHAAGLLV
ncbi:NAD(P)/FAD-dependent oxidoreductase [Streptomyces sp. Je 1-332]|uniref:flavin monoamine oxidase family protein n=1 Tax=Streptomyces sp. Je 1-332 TaxID=3231270 RepID=UPI0034589340